MDLAATPIPFDLYVAADLFLRTGRDEGEVLVRLGIEPARWAALSKAYFLLPLGDAHVGAVAALWPHLSREALAVALTGPRWRFPAPGTSLPEVARGIRAVTLPMPRVGPFADVDWPVTYLCDHVVAQLLYYSRDDRHVYFAGRRLIDREGAPIDIDAVAFRHLGGRWFTDGQRTYGQGERRRAGTPYWWTLEGADPASFQVLNHRYARDAVQAWYVTGKRIRTRGAPAFAIVPELRVNWRTGASTLEPDASLVARDAEHVYAFGARVPHADPARFRALGADYWTDDRRVWTESGKRAVASAEAASFHVVSPGDPPVAPGFGDATDRMMPYRHGEPISPRRAHRAWAAFFGARADRDAWWWVRLGEDPA